VSSLCCSRQLRCNREIPPDLGGQAMFLRAPPTDSAPLDYRALAKIADEFRPQLEMFPLSRQNSGCLQHKKFYVQSSVGVIVILS
jgi:hypothetical protein